LLKTVAKEQKNGDHKIRVAEIHLWTAKLVRAERRDSDEALSELGPATRDAPF
jgi:hypothetical protein